MAQTRRAWTRDELLVALGLYLRVPFGQISQRNPEIVRFAELLDRSPASLSMKMGNLASLDDSLERSGLRNASRADREIWAELKSDWSSTAESIAQANAHFGVREPETEPDLFAAAGEDVVAPTKVRRGQSMFRTAVLSAYQNRCCVTGLADTRLLNASHIVPWRDDPKSRLDPRNGLCLSVLHDRAFDRGLITFDEDLRLILSTPLQSVDNSFVRTSFTKFEGRSIRMPEKFAPRPDLLAMHRDNIFVG